MNFDQAKILVVGGAGFVGSALCRLLLKTNASEIVVVDNLLSAEADNVPRDDRIHFLPQSITQIATLNQLPKDFDYVFHLATFHGNQSSMAQPLADHEHNTLPMLLLCEHFANSSSLKRFVYASAGCTVAEKTFDDAKATDEDAPVSLYLDSPYQISKIIGEFYGNYYYMRHQLPFVKARFQNVYGPGEILGAGQWRGTVNTIWRNVTPTFIYKALKQQALPIEKGGVATRDFIYVDDIAKGLMACALNGENSGVYNLASGQETSIKDLALLINELTGNPTPLALTPARPWDRSGKRFGDPTRAQQAIGFSANTPLRDGLQETIDWTRQNIGLIERCMQRHQRMLTEQKETVSA